MIDAPGPPGPPGFPGPPGRHGGDVETKSQELPRNWRKNQETVSENGVLMFVCSNSFFLKRHEHEVRKTR